ncbi:MAG: exodeoxyribonuclease VII small subunit [Gemmatimonadota bacterium]|jgi:exodeoxyribonuclease VII small subunit
MADGTGGDLEGRLARLEAIVDALERDELELEAALALFEEGVGHLRSAREILRQTELRVEKLLADADDVEGQADGG